MALVATALCIRDPTKPTQPLCMHVTAKLVAVPSTKVDTQPAVRDGAYNGSQNRVAGGGLITKLMQRFT